MSRTRKLHTQRSRQLRARLTDAEQRLWDGLRELRPIPSHFRRQVPIGKHIVDFACLSAGLVVEVDGGQHFTSDGMAVDSRRDVWLASEGFRVLRFSNLDVLTNLDGVLEAILAALITPPPLSPPHKGEGNA